MPKKVKVGGPATPEDITAAYHQCTNPYDFTRLVQGNRILINTLRK